jgi:hypothetical protein
VVWTSSTCGSIISPSFVYLDIENNADASRAALGLVFNFGLAGLMLARSSPDHSPSVWGASRATARNYPPTIGV